MLTTNEAIILAGGRGTRLGSLTENTPKPLLDVGGKPFILYLINYLKTQGITRVVISTGYKAEAFQNILPKTFKDIELLYCEEKTPLGTGGGLRLASELIKGERFFALNGDTYFPVSLIEMESIHSKSKAKVTIALKQLQDFDRYGTVTLQGERITGFSEKKPCREGLINGGVYLIEKSLLLAQSANISLSFEKDILEKKSKEIAIFSKIFPNYFLDLGVPLDFEKAQRDCVNWRFKNPI